MRFGVLGPLSVESPPGQFPALRGEHQRTLLAVLLLEADRQVPIDRLVEALWPAGPPKSHTSNLHTYVSRLRARIAGLRVEHSTRGYRLRAGPDELDMLAFRAEAAHGREAARTGDPATAARHFRRALAQWRGPVLAGLHIPLLDAEIARLESERLAAFEDCVDAELSTGRHGELTGELQAMITEHPLRERLAAQLMIALHRAGRQADALTVYRGLRTTLIDELGVEPGAEARRVHAAVLRGEDPVPQGLAVAAPPVWPLCQLPPDIADFAGREAELAALAEFVAGGGAEVPVTVITGEPGAGKSTLAVRAAHLLRASYPDGQLYVPLAGATAARSLGDVLTDLLRALGVTGPAIPDDVQARAAVYRGRLADRRVLVVLDDAADPEHVRALLPGTPGSAVLVTSRRRLSGLAGARRLALGPLSPADAGALLRGLAGAERVGRQRADAERIAAACGFLPLALRIAGSRLAVRPQLRLGLLADRLEDEARRLDELTVSDLRVRGSIALSYAALSPAAQHAFRRLGGCRGHDLPHWAAVTLIGGAVPSGTDPTAATAGTGPGEQVGRGPYPPASGRIGNGEDADEAIEELIEASLLQPTGADPAGEPRYRMHDLVRVFAAEQAAKAESHADRVAAIRGVADAALCLAAAAAARLPRTVPMPAPARPLPAQPLHPELVERLLARPEAWFAAERANLVTAIGTFCAVGWRADALLLLEKLSTYVYLDGHYADLCSASRVLRDAALEAGDQHRASLATATLSLLRHSDGQYAEAVAGYRECAGELAVLGDRPAQAWTEANLAHCLTGLGRAEEALEAVGRAHALFTVDGDVAGLEWVQRAQSAALHRLGRVAEALEVDRATLALAQRAGDARRIGVALQGFSWSLQLNGKTGDAAEAIGESVRLLRHTTARSALAKSLRTQGAIHAGLGARGEAVAAFEGALDLARQLDERPRELSCTRAIAASWIGEGRAAQAIPVLLDCLAEFRTMGGRAATDLTWRVLGRAHEAAGDTEAAEAARREAERLRDPRDASASVLEKALLTLAEPRR
ncbi:AfsR/SARP family transcriptional regulator [Amycolatopsis samaneae]|uniref:BTAD domain-containing putative transcriptional regulator n=1 Tax=Amycolatopsis samaneae TaxID=664691 RepID=A0ABW5GN11_9PSEU